MLADNSWCPKLINTTEKHYFGINSEHRKKHWFFSSKNLKRVGRKLLL